MASTVRIHTRVESPCKCKYCTENYKADESTADQKHRFCSWECEEKHFKNIL